MANIEAMLQMDVGGADKQQQANQPRRSRADGVQEPKPKKTNDKEGFEALKAMIEMESKSKSGIKEDDAEMNMIKALLN